MSTDVVGTESDPAFIDRTGFINRIREAVGDDRSRAEALRLAVRAAGCDIGWHESEVVAEALRHRYDEVKAEGAWVPVWQWRDADQIAHIRRDLRYKLIIAADEAGSALVDEPVEWTYAAPLHFEMFPPSTDERGRTPLTAAQVAALPDDYHVLIRLVGHVQRLDS
jgi:hypothetical protein